MLLNSSSSAKLARSVCDQLKQEDYDITAIDIGEVVSSSTTAQTPEIVISSNRYPDDNASGVVIFTSGTTGKPKGSVLRRAYVHESALAVADSFNIQLTDTLLHTLPVHHATGLGTSFFPFLATGACIEFSTGSFDANWIWNRFREGGITIFSGVPTMYLRLMWHYQKHIANLPMVERKAFDFGVQALKSCLCGSSALQQPVQDFWTEMRHGNPILVRYGSSEIPGCIRVPAYVDPCRVLRGCVGIPAPGVDVKIDEDGELLIKSPHMFSK